MPAHDEYLPALEKLFRRQPVVLLDVLRRALGTTSRTTVFRVLRPVGYRTSFSHAGKYYTLEGIPAFDADGLWFWRDVGFSAHGTLRATIASLVGKAPAGSTHEELQGVLRLRVHDTLRDLVAAQELVRERVDQVYVYVSPEPAVAAAQLARRRPASVASAPPTPQPLALARVVDVLLAVIHHPDLDVRGLAVRLHAEGLTVSEAQVQDVFARYDLGKKTAPSRSRRSQR